MKSRGAALLPVLLALATAPTGAGQDQKPAMPPRFTARAELVLIPAIVTDRNGKPVTGLTKDDFTVQENGSEQKIATFEEIQASDTVVHRTAGKDGVYTNVMTGSTEARRVNIIVFDMVNTGFLDQAYARREIIKFLGKSIQNHELTTLLSFNRSGVKVIHDFTTDPQILAAALQKVRGEIHAMAGENEEAEADAYAGVIDTTAVASEAASIDDMMRSMEAQTAQLMRQFAMQWTLDAFRNIAAAYAGIPGRKALIWVTGSFPFQLDDMSNPRAMNFAARWSGIVDQLNNASIAVYPVDARGLVVVGFGAASRGPANARTAAGSLLAQFAMQRATIDTLNNFAEMTGGRAFYNTNDIAGAAARAAQDGAHYYVLGYYRRPQPGEKPGWRKLHVKTAREHVQVRARSGFFVSPRTADEAELRRTDLHHAAESPFDFTALPLYFRLHSPATPAPNGKKRLAFEVALNGGTFTIESGNDNFVSLEFVALARDASLNVADSISEHLEAHLKPENVRKIMAEGMSYHSQLLLPPGEYNVRVVVRDNLSGRVGSLLAPVKVE